MRIVSLVPSLTEAVAALGRADALVGVTRWCEIGAPDGAARIGGTKNPDVAAVVALAPDLVLANTEENRAEDLAALRAAGLAVHETFPRRVADVAPMLRELGALLDGGRGAGGGEVAAAAGVHAAAVESALRAARAAAGAPLRTLTLIWRKPWMAAAAGTFAADLLAACGLAPALDGADGDRYPRLAPGDARLDGLDLVLLPSEPYAFSAADLPAVRRLTGDVPHAFVDGRLLTWHGVGTARALTAFAALAASARGRRIAATGPAAPPVLAAPPARLAPDPAAAASR